jgi:hypothetical protein
MDTLRSLLDSHLLWYLNRATGVVLVAVLTLSAVLGAVSASGRASARWPRFALQTLHRNVTVLACALLVAHAATPVIDTFVNNYAPISWVDAFVPFVSDYKPLALGLGTLAFDLLLVVVVSSVARHRFGHRAWFSLHLLSYAALALGIAHGFLAGTDARTVWGLGVTAGAVVAAVGALVVRVVPPRRPVAPAPDLLPQSEPSLGTGRRAAVAAERTTGRRAAGRRTSV